MFRTGFICSAVDLQENATVESTVLGNSKTNCDEAKPDAY